MKNKISRKNKIWVRRLLCASLLSGQPMMAFAQTTPAPTGDEGEVIIITGYRASLNSALNEKRKSAEMIDAIKAEDIAEFPDANLAASLQRIPGVTIDRENGEGRQISVRGLGPDFVAVRLNGMPTLSLSGAGDTAQRPLRSRGFDFSTFASELFESLTVRKSTDAKTDEGSLGATVDLRAPRPFDSRKNRAVIGVQGAWFENGGEISPRITGLFSRRWADDRLGFLGSIAYQERKTNNPQYRNGVDQSSYTYATYSYAGNEFPQRAGFAAPLGTIFNQTVNTTTGALTNTAAISNPEVVAALTGSDPTAYAALYPAGLATGGRFDDTRVILPVQTATHNQHDYNRLGLTGSFQMRPAEGVEISFDYLASRFENTTDNHVIVPIGINRNNTNATLNTLAAVTPSSLTNANISQRRGLYPGLCNARAETDFVVGIDCGAAFSATPAYTTGANGLSAVMGQNIFSTNPNNLDVYDYYNNPNSPGFAPNAYGINGRTALIGRPAVKVLGAKVENGLASYLALSNVDWRTSHEQVKFQTDFDQFSINYKHKISPKLSTEVLIGMSSSKNTAYEKLIEVQAMNRLETYVIDLNNKADVPYWNPGFNAADPNNWTITKGFSVMRNFVTEATSKQDTARFDLNYILNDNHNIDLGITARTFEVTAKRKARANANYLPTEKEAGVSIASLGKVYQAYEGMDVPAGTITSFFAPEISAFSRVFGFDCNCINKYGDWRISEKVDNGNNFDVTEETSGSYIKWNFEQDVFFDGLISGNIGVRHVTTDITANGRTPSGRTIRNNHSYSDTLPSLNLTYVPAKDLYLRFAASKAMTRPILGNLTPTVAALNVPSTAGAVSGGSLTIGNTRLKPFRSKNYDFAAEWYFNKSSLVSAAIFYKDITSYPQSVAFETKLTDILDAAAISQIREQFTANAAQLAYIDGNNSFTAIQSQDAPGGFLRGIELNYQQTYDFLPGAFKNLGVLLNYTNIDSKLSFILDPGTATRARTLGSGPWLGASPESLNATVFYSTKTFDARISMANRSGFKKSYPILGGSCAPGLQDPTVAGIAASQVPCDRPLINDSIFSRETSNVDAKATWYVNNHMNVSIEASNLTNEMSNEYAFETQQLPTLLALTGRQVTVGVRFKY